jgi:hypothetical protein
MKIVGDAHHTVAAEAEQEKTKKSSALISKTKNASEEP